MANVKIKYNVKPMMFKRSIRKLQKNLTSTVSDGMRSGLNEVVLNIKKRFNSTIGKSAKPEIQALYDGISVGAPSYDGNNLTIGIGNVSNLDAATRVMAKKTGKTYSLWRLLEFGFGMKGGTRADKYPIEPVEKKALAFWHRDKFLIVSRVMHPGALGKHFFLDRQKEWYKSDRDIVRRHIKGKLQEILMQVNFKG